MWISFTEPIWNPENAQILLTLGLQQSGSETLFIELGGTMQKMIDAVYWVAVEWDHGDPWDTHVVIEKGPLGQSMSPPIKCVFKKKNLEFHTVFSLIYQMNQRKVCF